jgi:LuxR family transcriptional regulator
MANAPTVAEVWSLIATHARNIGFDNIIFGTNRLRKDGTLGDKSDTFILSDLPDAFMKVLWEGERYKTSALVEWAGNNTGVVSLETGNRLVSEGKLTNAQAATHQLFFEQGVTSGYIIGLQLPNSTVASILGLLNFGQTHSEAARIWDREKDQFLALATIFNLRTQTLPVPLVDRVLTKRQLQVLRWIGQGKTMTETATILGIAPATVEKHLRQARETLGVATSTQAVLHAQINGQIFTES